MCDANIIIISVVIPRIPNKWQTFTLPEYWWIQEGDERDLRQEQWSTPVDAATGKRTPRRRQKGRANTNANSLKLLLAYPGLIPALATVYNANDQKTTTRPKQRAQDERRIANISLKFFVFLALRCV